MQPKPNRTIAIIDLLRFGCALLVVAHHYATMFALDPPGLIARSTAGPMPPDWAWWSWSGWVGVEIFFVISGYVIAMSAADGDGLGFLRRRILRLAPAAWICATLTAILILAADPLERGAVVTCWLASITFWPIAAQIDAPYWTLAIELAFYLLIATQLSGRRANPAAIERTGLALAGATLLYWVLAGVWHPIANSSRAADILLLPYGAFFATGIALWAIRSGGVTRMRLSILALGFAGSLVEIVHQSAFMARGLHLPYGSAVPLAVFSIAVASLALARPLQSYLISGIDARRLALIGKTTYPLYLVHHELGAVIVVRLRAVGVSAHLAIMFAALAALAAAALIAAHGEPVVRRLLAKALSRRRAPEPDTRPIASPRAG